MDKPPAWAIRTKADHLALKDYYWDDAAGRHVVDFCHQWIEPQFITGTFQLATWQERLIRSLYSWKHKRTKNRRWRKAILHCPKKVGKTLIASLISLYETFAAGVKSARVASASTSKENAAQIFDEVLYQLSRNKTALQACKITNTDDQKHIECPALNAQFVALSAQASTHEGRNLSCCIVDESAWHENWKLFETLEYATIARPDGFLLSISTSCSDLSHPYRSLYTKAKNILSGADTDPEVYAEVYEADADCDIDDPDQWVKAHPPGHFDGLTGFTVETFKSNLDSAKTSFGTLQNFKLRRLNLWVSTKDTQWIQGSDWVACEKHYDDEFLAKCPSGGGVDGSLVEDPFSFSLTWALPNGHYYCRSWAWVCEEGVKKREKSLLPKYDQFTNEGSMTITDGNMIDRNLIYDFITQKCNQFRPIKLIFDHNTAAVFMNDLMMDGWKCESWAQSHRYFDFPMKTVEGLVKGRKIHHSGSQYQLWGLQNVRVEVNRYGECRPDSGRSIDHVDCAISLLQSFGAVYQGQQEDQPMKDSPISFVDLFPTKRAPAQQKPFWTKRDWC